LRPKRRFRIARSLGSDNFYPDEIGVTTPRLHALELYVPDDFPTLKFRRNYPCHAGITTEAATAMTTLIRGVPGDSTASH
jgi:hypothetical protein